MNKVTNLLLILLISTLSSLAHGSMLSRLKSAASTRAARSIALCKAAAKNIKTEASQAKKYRDEDVIDVRGAIVSGLAGASVGAGISYAIGYSLYSNQPCLKHRHHVPLEYYDENLRKKMHWDKYSFSKIDNCKAELFGKAFGVVGAVAGCLLGKTYYRGGFYRRCSSRRLW